MKPHVWTIAGMDPTQGAGVLSDCETFSQLKVQGFAITTALTAQNGLKVSHIDPVDTSLIEAQFFSLKKLGWPKAIKVGLLPTREIIHCVKYLLKDFKGEIIYDPIMISSSGKKLIADDALASMISFAQECATILTPNKAEAEKLTQIKINSSDDMQQAARNLCHQGVKQVVLKGGHLEGDYAQDLLSNGKDDTWLTQYRLPIKQTHGTGCVFSAALTAFLAQGNTIVDACVLAKMVVTCALRRGYSPVSHIVFAKACGWPQEPQDLPWITLTAHAARNRLKFVPCQSPIGFYPIVENADWVKKLILWQVKSIQLRIKDMSLKEKEKEISQAIEDANRNAVQLFINDDWQLALKYSAYGVHLGQEDIQNADLSAIADSGLRLGISTHSYAELARAYALNPSYIAFGPIYATQTKPMSFSAQGTTRLAHWRQLVQSQLVAIGGIKLNNVHDVLKCGVDGVSIISAVTKAQCPQATCESFLGCFA